MNRILLLLTIFLICVIPGYSLDKIDERLLKYAKEATGEFADVKQLHDYLIKPAKNNREKAELFFYWISQHIEYDINKYDDVFKNGERVSYNPVVTRKGICEDYTGLFKGLCDLSNIECYYITGYGKTSSYKKGDRFDVIHAWNIVKLDNEFEFVDCTWGSGKMVEHPDGSLKYQKNINTSIVFVNSNEFRTTHLPESPKWQLLEHPVSYKAYTENADFDSMYDDGVDKFMYKDSIARFNEISEEFQPIQERIDAYNYNPDYRNAFECGRDYELAAQELILGEFNKEDIKRARTYYETSKKWYVKSFKMLNNNSKNPDRSNIEFIKKVNKKIQYCDYRLRTKK